MKDSRITDDYLESLRYFRSATIEEFKKALAHVEKINGIRLRKSEVPEFYTYDELLRITKSGDKDLSEKEKDAKEMGRTHPPGASAVHSSGFNTVTALCETPKADILAHEIQHSVDSLRFGLDALFSEFRAEMAACSLAMSAKDLELRRRIFSNLCGYARNHPGEKFNSTSLIREKLGNEIIEGGSPCLSVLSESLIAGVCSYPLICDPKPGPIKRNMALFLDIHKKRGKKDARKQVLQRFCGIEELDTSLIRLVLAALDIGGILHISRYVDLHHERSLNGRFLEAGFPQETAELRDYRCESLQRRALECLESIARGD